jgi:hypothetical protein
MGTYLERACDGNGKRMIEPVINFALMDSAPIIDETFPIPEMDSNGVDLSQIRRHLERTPTERLRALETLLGSILEIRRGIGRPTIPGNTSTTTR